jgi:hypothetical protein
MSYRKIIDSTDQAWDVWEVVPSRVRDPRDDHSGRESAPAADAAPARRGIVVPPELQAGWLAFQSASERRRIAPVPSGWDKLPDDALLTLLSTAPVIVPQWSR